jgi:uncharacterized cupredoxin-like copper-binding protein
MKSTYSITVFAVLSLSLTTAVQAHGDQAHKANTPAAKATVVKAQTPWGIADDAAKVTRTIRIEMLDTMRFSPNKLAIQQGETIRFEIRNKGTMLHEMVIGTKKDLDTHAAMMVKFPTMEHDEPYMAHVAAGKKSEIVWTFNKSGDFDFACLIAGHYQAGMVGKISVKPKTKKETK